MVISRVSLWAAMATQKMVDANNKKVVASLAVPPDVVGNSDENGRRAVFLDVRNAGGRAGEGGRILTAVQLGLAG